MEIIFILPIGAAQGKGRGRQVIAVARTADLILMILDATKKDIHKQLLEKELDSVGIRLNQKPPNIYFKQKKAGGISFNSTVPLSRFGLFRDVFVLLLFPCFSFPEKSCFVHISSFC